MTDQVNAEILDRPPRIQHSQLVGEIDIPAPPIEQDSQSRNMLLSILPVASMGFIGIFYLVAGGRSGNATFAMPMLMMGGITVVVSLLTFGYQNVQTRRQFMVRRRDYNRQIDRRVERLQAARELQLEADEDTFPPPHKLLERVQELDLSLWSRRPEDPDFLEFRPGTGEVESGVIVKLPDPDSNAPDIRRAVDLVFDYKYLPATAMTVNLLHTGSLGITGRRGDTLTFAYNMLAQLATFHAPSDLDIYIFSSQVGYQAWNWARWLPHTSHGNHGGFPDFMAFGAADVRQLLDALVRRIESWRSALSGEGNAADGQGMIVVLFDHLDNLKEEVAFKALLQSHDIGIMTVCLLDDMAQVPGECNGVIEIRAGRFELKMTGKNPGTMSGSADTMTRAQAEVIARQLANYTQPQAGDSGRVPARVGFLQMYDAPTINRLDIVERWRRPVPSKGILPFPAPIGSTSFSSQLMFDLSEHAHGPHGVVAGTTGSGKSELLQTLVCALAAEHHPYLLNFLLVDYKGGATFNVFRNMPHTAGIITNLNVVEALRALEAIKSENRRRQIFLADQNAEDITEYHKRLGRAGGRIPHDWQPMPHLVIIVDEFAELKAELPTFLDELVATVRVGRSLGMHLILATQRPAGHVTQDMSANLNFRIALRVQNPEESREMIRRPDSAYIPPSIPGRAYFLVGNDLQEFQSAWVGMEYDESAQADEPEESPITLRLLRGEKPLAQKHADAPTRPAEIAEPTESKPERIPVLSEVLANHMVQLYSQMDYRLTETVFLESLADAIPLPQVLAQRQYGGWDGADWQPPGPDAHWGRVPAGLIDDIPNRAQPPLEIEFPELGGHILVAGGAGTGKTTFLRTLAMGLAHVYRPDEIEIYALSLTGRVLDMLEGLPHVGAVIRNEENERIDRLFRRLVETLETRRYMLAQLNADDLTQYNNRVARQGGQKLPAIFVLIDNFVELQKYFQEDIEGLVSILRDSRAVGIYFAITTPSVGISYKVVNLIQQRLALRLTEKSDYLQLIGRNEGREVNPRPGSGLLSGKPLKHVQIALPGAGEDDDQRIEDMQRTIAAMADAWGERRPKAAPIITLPTSVPLERMLAETPERVPVAKNAPVFEYIQTPIALESSRLQTKMVHWLHEGPHFIINGPVGSGKSSLLRTMLLGLTSRYSPDEVRVLLVDFSQQSLRRLHRLPHVIEYIADEDSFVQHLRHFVSEITWRAQELQRRKQEAEAAGGMLDDQECYSFPPIIVAIDDYEQLRDMLTIGQNSLAEVSRLVRSDSRLGIHFVIAGETTSLTGGSDRLVKQIKLTRSGFCLVSAEAVDFMGGRTTRAMRQTVLLNGRGYQITRNTMELMQFAHLQEIGEVVRDIANRWSGSTRATWEHPADLTAAIPAQPEPAANGFSAPSSNNASFSADFDFDLSGAVEDYKKQQAQKPVKK